ncbi:MAG TPA: NADH-quinone oxidoreductase subunit J [Actinomycetota bacterium]|nr:NADH-quinone oxidoreductase subunit J [Actinomycetota bacterium]
MQGLIFLVVAAVSGFAAVRLVTNKNLVHAALYLVVTLLGMAIIFLLLTAEFVAWVQVLIYVGAVIVLLLFGLMLTRAQIGKTALDRQQRWVAGPVALVLFAVTTPVLWRFFDGRTIDLSRQSGNTAQLGTEIFTRFVLPFEVVSVLLLAALVGAVFLAKRD